MKENEINDVLNQEKNSTDGAVEEKGYGFGLSFVQHLVMKKEGTIEVESEKNVGRIFIVNTPI